jgi:hypothetical protein
MKPVYRFGNLLSTSIDANAMKNDKKASIPCDIDIRDLTYDMPRQKDMAVCFVYFNASNSKRILMNFLYVQNMMQLAQIPTFTMEVYSNKPAIYKSFRIKSDSVLFHKERLFYLLEKQVPAKYTKLLFLDADIVFDNPNWYDDLSKALDTYDIVHPYEKAIWLDLTYTKKINECETVVKYFSEHCTIGYGCHVGFAWAFKRQCYNQYGFFQHCIVGSGDSLSCMAWFEQDSSLLAYQVRSKYEVPAYIEFCKSITYSPKISYIGGNVYHLYHGTLSGRKYVDRHSIFKDVEDVRTILKEDESGLFEITDPKIAQKVKDYFKSRNDDGV